MNQRFVWATLAFLCPVLLAFGQDNFFALKLSQPNLYGSARMQGMGGVGTALGADISNLSGNPAGLGFFRKSEWTVTPSLGVPLSSSTYLSNTTTGNKVYFSVPNFGIVIANPKDDIVGGKWRGGSFGFGFTRTGNYQDYYSYEGNNNKNSFMGYIRDSIANGYFADEVQYQSPLGNGFTRPDNSNNSYFDSYLAIARIAYLNYLINPVFVPITDEKGNIIYDSNGKPTYGSDATYQIPIDQGSYAGHAPDVVNQKGTVNTSGGNFLWNASYGGNIDNRFYFGVSLGYARVRYERKETITETVTKTSGITLQEPTDDFKSLTSTYYAKFLNNYTFTDNLTTTGGGVNAKLGIMFRATDNVRIGATIITPTKYTLKDEYSQSINATFGDAFYLDNNGNKQPLEPSNAKTATGNATYALRMPWKASVGISAFAGKRGFVTAEAEYIPYKTNMRYFISNNGPDFTGQNEYISSDFKDVINFKAGGELRLNIYRLRAGASYMQSPVKDTYDNLNRDQLNFTAGAGIRNDRFYLDAGAVYSYYKSAYTPYSNAPSVISRQTPVYLVLSFGSFF